MNPPRGFGGVEVPPRDWGSEIESLRAQITGHYDKLYAAILSLEKRYYDQQMSSDEMAVELERLHRRLDDGKRDSVIDEETQEKVLEIVKAGASKSDPPDIEFSAPSGRRVRGNGWGVVAIVVLALVALAIVVIYRGPQFVGEVGKLLH